MRDAAGLSAAQPPSAALRGNEPFPGQSDRSETGRPSQRTASSRESPAQKTALRTLSHPTPQTKKVKTFGKGQQWSDTADRLTGRAAAQQRPMKKYTRFSTSRHTGSQNISPHTHKLLQASERPRPAPPARPGQPTHERSTVPPGTTRGGLRGYLGGEALLAVQELTFRAARRGGSQGDHHCPSCPFICGGCSPLPPAPTLTCPTNQPQVPQEAVISFRLYQLAR